MRDNHQQPGLTRYEQFPKVELHIHLEGAIPHEVLWELIRKYGGDRTVTSIEKLRDRFTYRDFPHFIDTWVWKNGFLREYEDFSFIASEIARDLARQNVRYVEAFYSPGDFRRRGLDPGRITEASRQGLDQVPNIEVALVADLIRDHGPDLGAMMLAAVNDVREYGVIGVGIGGSEQQFPPEAFAEVFEQARNLGFHTSAHAGEAAGPESVWGAVRALRVERIGHGTRASEDPTLVDHLARHKIPVELCTISNLRTGAVQSIKEHPARLYFERGIPISINTDDPTMFGTSLAEEYVTLEEELGFRPDEIESIILQSIETSWLSEERKQTLRKRFEAEFADLGDRGRSIPPANEKA